MMTTKPSEILGMNARNRLYTSLNSARAKSICTSKFATKVLLQNKDIPTAQIYGILATIEDVNDFDWENLGGDFVLKPTNGHAGKGVVAFRNQHKDKQHWTDVIGRVWSLNDIKLHCYDTLEGAFSTHGSDHKIIVEQRIQIHPKLLKYTYKGTPDIRVFVFNNVPVMAALRLPTEESEGRANITQGAIAVGIDVATGITTHATMHKNHLIKFLPGTKKKLNGIKIPFWNQTLVTAIKAAQAADLVYCGVDLFLDKDKGPMVVELNAYPGLSFQIANLAGLRKRLERVENLNVIDANHGVRIGQALFAETFSDKIIAKEGLTVIEPKEEILVYGDKKKKERALAQISTGRYRSAIASELAGDLDLIDPEDLLWFQQESGEGKVPVVEVKLKLKNKTIKTAMLVSKRLNRTKYKLEIGNKDLAGFLVGVKQ